MTQEKRLDTLEGDLTPKELMIRFLREAHEYGDYTSYGTWLLTQTEEAYPLVKLPKAIYAGTRARLRGKKDEELRAALRSSYRDLLFLFHLHSQLNERVTFRLQELRWCSLFLAEQLRRFMDLDSCEEDLSQLLRLIPGKKPRLPRRDTAHDQETLTIWRELAAGLDEEVRHLLGAAKRLSTRYYSGEDLLYPEARTSLLEILEVLFRQQRLYHLCYGTKTECQQVAATMDEPFLLGPLSGYGRDLAGELVTLAKAEALTALGEQQAGIQLVEKWLRASGT